MRILISAVEHDPVETTRLVKRLILAGADVNARSRRGDGVLDALNTLGGPESEWEDLYDALFSAGICGIDVPNRAGVSPLENARKRCPHKDELIRRMEQSNGC